MFQSFPDKAFLPTWQILVITLAIYLKMYTDYCYKEIMVYHVKFIIKPLQKPFHSRTQSPCLESGFFNFESGFSKVKSGFSQWRVRIFSGSGFFSSPDFLRVRIRVRVSNYAASVGQSSEQAPFTSEIVGSIYGPIQRFSKTFSAYFQSNHLPIFKASFESNQLSKNWECKHHFYPVIIVPSNH
jgi:hypothetical protein